jgi:hypothetical protein
MHRALSVQAQLFIARKTASVERKRTAMTEATSLGNTQKLRSHARMTAALAACVLAAGGWIGERAQAAIITNWNMNAVDPASSPMAYASTGVGVANLSAFGANAGTLLGTTLGGVEGDIAGNALSITGSAANGLAMTFDFDASMYTNLSLSFAVRRSTTGFSNNRIDWWDGLAWTTVARFGASATAWEVQSFDFSTYDAMDGRGAYFRIVVDGATSSSGSIRFDNIRFAGEPVPAPGALALLGLAGCLVRTKRTARRL